jgi:hypothetical protein
VRTGRRHWQEDFGFALPPFSAVNLFLQHGAEFGAGFSAPFNLHPGAERERTASMLMASEFVIFVSIG